MCDRSEIIVTSDTLSGGACIWDPSSGTSVKKYRGVGEIEKNCLSFVGNDYLICSGRNKPLIHLWALNNQDVAPQFGKIIAPGCVTALAVSPTSEYCVIATGEKVSIWELASGDLINVTARHYRPINCIKFTDDGSYFVTSGEDGMVIVWPLAYLVSYQASELMQLVDSYQPEPKFVYSDHSLPVTDLYVGRGGIQALLVSVSVDQTCKIYCLADGNLLASLVLNCSLSAVTLSHNEMQLFTGSITGLIHKFNMGCMPRQRDYHTTTKDLVLYKGHSNAISCLSTSLNGIHLLSGSKDGIVILWDIKSGQSIKSLKLTGEVSNAFFAICPKTVISKNFTPSIVIQNFGKAESVGNVKITKFISKAGYYQEKEDPDIVTNTYAPETTKPVQKQHLPSMSRPQLVQKSDETDECEIVRLKQINEKLYRYTVKHLFETKLSGCKF